MRFKLYASFTVGIHFEWQIFSDYQNEENLKTVNQILDGESVVTVLSREFWMEVYNSK